MGWSDYVDPVLIYGEPDDGPTVVSLPSVEHTAAKRHVCDACGGWIEPGERYTAQKWVVEGEFQTMKAHRRACVQFEPMEPSLDEELAF